MPSASSLISRVDALLRRFDATDRVVYKRIIVREGGDPLIGSPASVSSTDVEFDPQPAIMRPSSTEPLVLSGTVVPLTDYWMIVSPNMLTADDLQDKDTMIVFKDTLGAEELLSIVTYFSQAYGGQSVYYKVLLRSKKR